MHISVKQAFLGKSFLRVTALIIGYLFWSILCEAYTTSAWFSVPLCFYNNTGNVQIIAPDTVEIQLAGKRSQLSCLDVKHLAAHISVQELKSGPQAYVLTAEHLFLPPQIALISYKPNNLTITLS